MGKVANEKRKKLFDKMFPKPTPAPPKPKPAPRVSAKPEPPPKCCLDRHKDNLPMNFRPCIDCPNKEA